MPYKHEVTDSRGQVHKRTSQNRQYQFASVIHWHAWTRDNGTIWPARSHCNWASSEKLARKSASQYFASHSYDGHEIIPCTPVCVGKHK